MKKRNILLFTALSYLPFLLCTLGSLLFDRIRALGFANLNWFVLNVLGESKLCETVSELLGYLAIAVVGFFGLFGFVQLLRRKSLKKIDPDLFVLVGTYALMLAFYVLFEIFPVNYRPIAAEASYPSSHTMLITVVMCTAALQVLGRVRSKPLRVILTVLCLTVSVTATVARLLSGVHWFTDIVGGVLLSAALVVTYAAGVRLVSEKK